jgi:hypothetical protein
MKDRTEFLYPGNGADGPVIPLNTWIPPKTLLEDIRGFKIFKSAPVESPNGTIQLAVAHPTIHGDMLRADSYKEGYFAATWLSKIKLPEFLDASEKYFQEFEDQFKGEVHGTMGVFTSWRDPEFWEFGRPVRMGDFEKNGVFVGNNDHPLGLLRFDTPPGDICYEPEDETVGIIAYLDQGKEQPVVEAVSRLVTRTQSQLPEDVVTRTLGLLPYRRSPTES